VCSLHKGGLPDVHRSRLAAYMSRENAFLLKMPWRTPLVHVWAHSTHPHRGTRHFTGMKATPPVSVSTETAVLDHLAPACKTSTQ
jgi:hypothetical protein